MLTIKKTQGWLGLRIGIGSLAGRADKDRVLAFVPAFVLQMNPRTAAGFSSANASTVEFDYGERGHGDFARQYALPTGLLGGFKIITDLDRDTFDRVG